MREFADVAIGSNPLQVTRAVAPSPSALFAAFFSIALSGFGGVLPFARRTLVDRREWLTAAEFTETLSLCQSLPGPNVVNMSIVVGGRACGWQGSVAAFAGLVATPVAIVKVSLPLVLVGLAPISIGAAWAWKRRL